MIDWPQLLLALLLLLIVNGAPIIAARVLGGHANWPVDSHACLWDGRPAFGRSKTWRGLAAALLAGTLFAPIASLSTAQGALVSLLAMLGDLFSSFLKRRLGIAPSGRCLILDQVPESLLPLVYLAAILHLTASEIAVAVVLFFLADVLLSRILFRLKIRQHPY